MMAVRWSWCVLVATALVGCSGGGAAIETEVPSGGDAATADAGGEQGDSAGASSDAGTLPGDGGAQADAAPVEPPSWTITGKNLTTFSLAYALQYGDTIEVAFSNAPPTVSDGKNFLVFVWSKGDGGTDYVYRQGDVRNVPRCQVRAIGGPATGPDVSAVLSFDAAGSVAGKLVDVNMPGASGTITVNFAHIPVAASTYVCP